MHDLFDATEPGGCTPQSPAATAQMAELERLVAQQAQELQQLREAQLSQRLEGLGLFAGGIAQRLNSLLIGILGNASLALGEVGPNVQLASILSEIEHASLQARSLTGQMLALAGRSVNLAPRVDLNDLVSSALDRLEAHLPSGLTLECELAPDLPRVAADTAQLQHALLQLIDNCAEAHGLQPGRIRLRTGLTEHAGNSPAQGAGRSELPAGRYCYVEVADDAGGIPPERLPRLFDPFRAGREASRGLGLPTVQGILRAHRGAVQLDSRPGAGTTVRLMLPAEEAAASTSARGCIMVVDDEQLVQAVAAGILRRHGYEVLCAASGEEALACHAAQAARLGAVLLDLTMPGMDGAEVLLALRERDAALPVIISSGYAEHEVQARLADCRPAGLMQKPYSAAELLAEVERVLSPRMRMQLISA